MAYSDANAGSGKSTPKISIGQYSIAGRKERNDDSYGVVVPSPALVATHGIAMAIADGMSSSEGAKEASECAIKSFLEDYYCTHASWSVKKSVGVVLKAVNSWLYAQSQREYQAERAMVCTFSGLILKAGTAHLFHAGDCRISILRNGRLETLTRDHRVRVGKSYEHLSRALGVDQHIEIDYRAEAMEPGDVLLLTTDGVHDHVMLTDIAEIITGLAHDLDAAAKAIVDRAYKHGSPDNLTCQIVRADVPGRVDEAGHAQNLAALPFPPELAPGKSFDGYAVLRELHTSRRSQVYLARDEASGDTVVLKTPSVNFEDDPAYVEMFAREEWLGKLIDSPHVLKVLPPQRARRHLYMTTEFFDGQTLRQWMRDNPRPDLETMRMIVEQIATGLRAFHRKDIIHQDVKPENVMIDRQGLVKIIDFGSARAAGLDEMASAIERPGLVGTIDYTAPEYHLGEVPTNRADIYSLGVIAYELLTGRLPYGKGFTSRREVERLAYIPAHDVREYVPLWIDAALELATRRRQAERTEALSALIADLRRPNTSLGYDRPRPLIERNPVGFWRAVALVLLLTNIVLAFLLSR
ncbi:MAG TPA: bifunctional protein-serine/threonine kinase/phosphatase [Xanthobacteraceae bacterium]|nr:bifunctional protein-serine/threonine kinase/phosphatase [Xanthobacteraceae bacterium]